MPVRLAGIGTGSRCKRKLCDGTREPYAVVGVVVPPIRVQSEKGAMQSRMAPSTEGKDTMSEFFIGQIMMAGFNFAPKSWAMCNGQLLPIAQNQALFSLLGTQYGGNGVTN